MIGKQSKETEKMWPEKSLTLVTNTSERKYENQINLILKKQGPKIQPFPPLSRSGVVGFSEVCLIHPH